MTVDPKTQAGRDSVDTPSASRIAPRSPRTALEPERVPEPKRPSRRARHPFIVAGNAIFTIVLLVAVVAGVGFTVGKQRFEAPGPLADEKVINIPRGLGWKEIGDLLAREGVIDQAWVFSGSVLLLKARGEDLKAGEYRFAKAASIREVVETIVEGKVIHHHFTIPEGLTSQQIVQRLMESDLLTGNIKEIPREGTLLPETYNVPRGMPREQMIQRMQNAQKRALQEVWERRSADVPVRSAEELVVLASLVEKETGKPDERSRVAAVFVNRIRQKMKLQSDPTIIYGLVGGKGTLGRPIMRSEIDQATPYNTYVIMGLPPGPIANPGRAALEAAANPARTRELYFVADGTGGHAFADTLDQHQKNVAKLRQFEQQLRPTPGDPSAFAPTGQATSPIPNPPAAAPAAAPKAGAKKTPRNSKAPARTAAEPAPRTQ